MATARRADFLTHPPAACSVLIAAADVLPLLVERMAVDVGGEVLHFAETDALKALDAIVTRRPAVVALERMFAATPRGAALINRIKADAALSGSEIRIVSHDSDYKRISRPAPGGTPQPGAPAAAVEAPSPAAPGESVAVGPKPLDTRGTRRAPRFKIAGDVTIVIDGNPALLVDLSAIGAQVVSPTVIKPNQRVRLALADERAAVRLSAAVAWALFEIPSTGPRYRAGLAFTDADTAAVEAFCVRHSAQS